MTTSMRSYLAECFWPGVRRREVETLDRRVTESVGAGTCAGEQVRYCGSILMPRDEVVLCFFEGASMAAVEAAARCAGVPFARIVESTALPRHTKSDPW
jgi:hypothetical protein